MRIRFYEKTGCINNTKQKQLLRSAGYEVEAIDLLDEAWTAERLAAFLDELPLAERVNRSAPQWRDGELDPEALGSAGLYRLMIEYPILIRRPLLEVEGRRMVGFDTESLKHILGVDISGDEEQDLEQCPRGHDKQCSDEEEV